MSNLPIHYFNIEISLRWCLDTKLYLNFRYRFVLFNVIKLVLYEFFTFLVRNRQIFIKFLKRSIYGAEIIFYFKQLISNFLCARIDHYK